DDKFAEETFLRHPKTLYLGKVTPLEALRVLSKCDAVFAYYEPDSINNLRASPNKVFDAMAVGRPTIINSETAISEWIRQKRLGYCIPYDDVPGLRTILLNLGKARKSLLRFGERVRVEFVAEHRWEL